MKRKLLLFVAVPDLFVSKAQATLLVYEAFNYAGVGMGELNLGSICQASELVVNS